MLRLRTFGLALFLLAVAVPTALRSASPASADSPASGGQSEQAHRPGDTTAFFPTRSVTEAQRGAKRQASASTGVLNLINQSGGGVMETTRVHVVFWGWSCNGSGSSTCDSAVNYVKGFFGGTGGSNWLNSVTQYCGLIPAGTATCSTAHLVTNPSANATFIFDNKTRLPSRITQSSIANEASHIASGSGTGTNNLYIIMTPHGHSQSGFGTQWCGYHSYAAGATPYAYIPYEPDAGYACGANSVGSVFDGFSIVGGHELGEAMTDPLLNAWYDNNGAENGDKCAWTGLTTVMLANAHPYSVQPLWSNKSSSCVITYP